MKPCGRSAALVSFKGLNTAASFFFTVIFHIPNRWLRPQR
jgi:hypothetical protein